VAGSPGLWGGHDRLDSFQSHVEDNRDGHSHNRSWNSGVEGPTDDAAINALRERQKRNLLATLLLSQGTPLILAGDELGRTQRGNNNAYAQDNEISWLDWNIAPAGQALIRFVQKLTALRQEYPILRRSRFLTGEYNADLDVKDVTWINANGNEMQEADWADANTHCFGMLMDGRAQVTGIRQRGQDATLLLVLNSHHDLVHFVLPACPGGDQWSRLIDTNVELGSETETFRTGDRYDVTARSVLLFVLIPDQAR